MINKRLLTIQFILLFALLPFTGIRAQCVVYQDKQGQVLTTCDYYRETSGSVTPAHTQETYLGSPFMSFPVWQLGTIQLDKQGQELSCELAFNLVSNEVMCRFSGDSTTKLVIPEVFTTNGTTFTRQLIKLPGVKYHIYYTPLNAGKTRLLKSLTARLEDNHVNGPNRDIKGKYTTQTNYYIQQEDAQPQPVELTQKSLVNALSGPFVDAQAIVPSGLLSPQQVIALCQRYDSLNVIAQNRLAQLSWDKRLFLLLQHKIVYPGGVGKQGIYGRVYAGFTVDSSGRVGKVVLLSPDNIGFGFDAEVTKALSDLPVLESTSKGEYVVPIAFTFTNSREKSGPHVPVNRLPEERLANRTLLEEVVIPYTANNASITSREVWGYYK